MKAIVAYGKMKMSIVAHGKMRSRVAYGKIKMTLLTHGQMKMRSMSSICKYEDEEYE